MAITTDLLIALGGFAILASVAGTIVNFGQDSDTLKAFFAFLATLLWGTFALSSYDVILAATPATLRTGAILPFVYLGVGLAFVMFLMTLYWLVVASKASATTQENISLGD